MRKYIASIVTCCRIFGSLLLLFFPAFSAEFYIIYVICGISDMVDGTIARKISGVTQMGAKIDSVADIIFVIVSFFKILPTIDIPRWLWIWGFVIALVKIGNVIFGYVAEKQFISLHTILNKITGLLLFLVPLSLHFLALKYSSIAVCSVATIAAIQEGVFIATNCGTK